jgi:aspartate-semialdehyde dehydrogenase
MSPRPLRIGVAGATGAVGTELLRLLSERELPIEELRLLASPRSAGTTLPFDGGDVPVQELCDDTLSGLDLVFFSCGGDRSRRFAPVARDAGAVVIDNSSAFRLEPDVPLIVPEVNGPAVDGHRGIVAVPNCTTIVFLMAAAPLHRAAGIERAVVSSYQAASGAGAAALREYEEQTRAVAAGESPVAEVLPRVLHGNVIPHVDAFRPDGWTKEEMKLLDESRKILDAPELGVACTCVRVPVARAHSVSAALELRQPLSPERAREILAESPGVVVVDGGDPPDYPTPLDVSGRHEVAVGRIREDVSRQGGILFWAVGDQLLKGAAWNAVQIAELLIRRERL